MRLRKTLCILCVLWLAIVLVACSNSDLQMERLSVGVDAELDLDYAVRGEVVNVKLLGDNSKDAQVWVGGVPAPVEILQGNEFRFTVPAEAAAGRQQVVIELVSRTLIDSIEVLGDDVVDRQFTLLLKPGKTVNDVREMLDTIDFEVVEGPYALGGQAGPCSGERVRIRVAALDTGRALTTIRRDDGEGTVWDSNPLSGYSSGAAEALTAIGATESRLRGFTGTGTTIAVVDTGVSNHEELGSRLLLADGYDFVDDGTTAVDEFPNGHGTPVAVLAAGTLTGVAPDAKVLPVRVCDENGFCYTDDVLAGICYALSTAQSRLGGIDDLVINLSLGGETAIPAIREALDYALANGALVAASAGNGGENGSPAHYPAAFDLDGVVAVAALEPVYSLPLLGSVLTGWKPASFTTRGDYLDIAAPGAGLTSGSPDGLYRTDYTGTSYATALVAGALAVWNEAEPELSPGQIELGIEAAASPLDYPSNEVGAGMLDLSTQPQ